MRLTYGYQVAPGCCFSCRCSRNAEGVPGKVIDLERDDPSVVKREHVYLCEACVTAAFMQLDSSKMLVAKQAWADKDGEIVALTNEVTRLMDEAAQIDMRLVRAIASQPTDA